MSSKRREKEGKKRNREIGVQYLYYVYIVHIHVGGEGASLVRVLYKYYSTYSFTKFTSFFFPQPLLLQCTCTRPH